MCKYTTEEVIEIVLQKLNYSYMDLRCCYETIRNYRRASVTNCVVHWNTEHNLYKSPSLGDDVIHWNKKVDDTRGMTGGIDNH